MNNFQLQESRSINFPSSIIHDNIHPSIGNSALNNIKANNFLFLFNFLKIGPPPCLTGWLSESEPLTTMGNIIEIDPTNVEF